MLNNPGRKNNGKQKKKSSSEAIGIVLIIISAFFLVCLIFPIALSVIGSGVRNFLTGILGVVSFALFSATAALGILKLKGRRLAVSKRRAIFISLISVFGLMILQLITTHSLLSLSFGEHLSATYNFSDNFSIGGVIFSFFTMTVVSTISVVGAYLFFVALFLIFASLLATDIIKLNKKPNAENKRQYNKTRIKKTGSKEYIIQSDGQFDLDNVTNYGLYVGRIKSTDSKSKNISGEYRDFSAIDDEYDRIDSNNYTGGGSNSGNLGGKSFSDLFGFIKENNEEHQAIDIEGDRERARERLLGDKNRIGQDDKDRFLANMNSEKELLRNGSMTGIIQAEPMTIGSTDFREYDTEIFIDEFTKQSKIAHKPIESETKLKKAREKQPISMPEVVFQPPIDEQPFYNDEGSIIDAAQYSKYIASIVEKEQPKQETPPSVIIYQDQYPIENTANYKDNNFDDLTQKANAILASKISLEPQIRHEADIINCDNNVAAINSDAAMQTIASEITKNQFSAIPLDLPNDPTPYYNDQGIENLNENFIDIINQEPSQIEINQEQNFSQSIKEETFEYTKSNFVPNIDREFVAPAYEEDEQKNETKLKKEILSNVKNTLVTISNQIDKDNKQPAFTRKIINDAVNFLDNDDADEDKIDSQSIQTQTTTQSIDLSFASKLKNKSNENDSTIYLDNFDDNQDDENEQINKSTFIEYGTTPYKTAQKQDNQLQSAIFNQDEDYSGSYIKGHNSAPKEFSKRNVNHKIPVNQIHIDDAIKSDKEKLSSKSTKKIAQYARPPLDLLTADSTDPSLYGGDSALNAEKLEKVLQSLGLKVQVTSVAPGPAVTRYELTMPAGISIKKILNFADDIAYELAAKKGVRIEAPISGKRAVGVEVPNQEIGIVSLKDLIGSEEFSKASSNVTLCLGKDIAGDIVFSPLEKMPHLLVAGTTGSGKSACLNSLIVSMIYKSSPSDLRLILIDPKRVEFPLYQNLPHLLINQIINEREHAINAFKWVVSEMYERYKILSAHKVKNIQEYNASEAVKRGEVVKMPRIVIVVDELSDLMMGGYKKEMEQLILSISQLSRAAGINMILATQRPSVDVITGTIKANLPSRIAFAVSNGTDSKTILDQTGAEMLLGRGDLLYAPIDAPEPKRIQGAYVTTEEVEEIVKFICENNSAEYFDEAAGAILKEKEVEIEDEFGSDDNEENEFDPLLEEIARKIIETGAVSTSLLQRRYKLGYARGARIMDELEQLGFIGSKDDMRPTKPREIFATREMFEKVFGTDF
ncbi:MAG: FtsK/SpoIIIE domain-containing protein [Firmicutes bacterium]|nr:FtsK/SpoIIIE domain-containing protein [Bacillota bacterium]